MKRHTSAIKKMTFRNYTENKTCEPVRTLTLGNWRAQLLPGAPYQTAYRSAHSSVGYAFAHQTGVHAIGSDKRVDFRAAPNSIAYVPKGCDVYSESNRGGEYLTIWQVNEVEPNIQIIHHFRNIIEPAAVSAAHSLRRALIAGKLVDELACEQSFLILHSCVVQPKHEDTRRIHVDENQPHGKWSTQVLEYIEEKMNTRLTVAALAKTFNQSTRQFNRNFIRLIGMTPHSYIIERRLVQARNLLIQTHWDLSAIAYECGFSSHSHMTAQLRLRHGATPTQLKKYITSTSVRAKL